MKNYLKKWIETIRIGWVTYTAYRINFLLQVIGPALVFFFVKYNLWTSIYQGDPLKVIQNYTLEEMVNYHIWALVVGLLAQGHTAMNLSEDIRLGRISCYLIYPFNFWEFHTASFIAFQILQTFSTLITLVALYYLNLLDFQGFTFFIQGFCYTLFVSIFWFTLQYFTGLLAFWLEETWILRVMVIFLVNFFSGAIIPLEFFPQWITEILSYTPFPYLTFIPIKMFTGDYLGSFWLPYGVLTIWILFFLGLNSFIWRRGVRLYTGSGM